MTRSLVLGTAGHVDHGKTVLVEALTGINTDRWEEERRRGITIDLGFAPLATGEDSLEVSIVDVPGHEDFVKNMLAGATGLDLLLLVVAADEGPMPQTREHLWIARLLEMRRGVVALTKSDLVEAEWRSLAAEAVREELEHVIGHADWPVVPVSGRTGDGIEPLRAAILEAARASDPRRVDDLFRLPVDRSFTVRGVGTVVTGTVASGRVEQGAGLRALPAGPEARVRGLQVHGREVSEVHAGQRAAVALAGVDRAEIRRGDVLTDNPELRPTRILDARLEVIPDSRWGIDSWQRVRLHLGTAEVFARVVPLEAEALLPGEAGLVQLRLEKPVVVRGADRFVVRFYSPVTTIGGGVVLDPWPDPHRVLEPPGRESLGAVLQADPRDRLLVGLVRLEGSTLGEMSIRLGVPRADLRVAAESLADEERLREVSGRWYSTSSVEETRSRILRSLSRAHEEDALARGMDLESLRSAVGTSTELVNSILAEFVREGEVRLEGSFAALTAHRRRLTTDQAAMAESAEAEIRAGGAAPPTVQELCDALDVSEAELIRVLRFLAESGRLVAITPDLYLDAGAVEEIRTRVRHFLADRRSATPADFRDVIQVTRKYLIPILEHLDATGLTVRTPEGRVLRDR